MKKSGNTMESVFMLSSLMIHSSCFHSTGPPQGISDHQPKHVPLTEAQRHGGRGRIAMDGFERGGPKRHAVYSMCAHCAAFRSCQKWNKHSTCDSTMRFPRSLNGQDVYFVCFFVFLFYCLV